MEMNEIEASAIELRNAHNKASKEQATLNQSDNYWKASAFKASVMKDASNVFASVPEIVVQSLIVKSEATKLKAITNAKCPVEVKRVSSVKTAFKQLCLSILKPSEQHLVAGVAVKDYTSFKQAFEALIAVKVAPMPASAPVAEPVKAKQ